MGMDDSTVTEALRRRAYEQRLSPLFDRTINFLVLIVIFSLMFSSSLGITIGIRRVECSELSSYSLGVTTGLLGSLASFLVLWLVRRRSEPKPLSHLAYVIFTLVILIYGGTIGTFVTCSLRTKIPCTDANNKGASDTETKKDKSTTACVISATACYTLSMALYHAVFVHKSIEFTIGILMLELIGCGLGVLIFVQNDHGVIDTNSGKHWWKKPAIGMVLIAVWPLPAMLIILLYDYVLGLCR